MIAGGFGKLVGEPPIDKAIAYEDAHETAADHAAGHPEQPLVSRGVQNGAGLFSASLILGLSMGGIFALVFAAAYGRVGRASPAATALWLAGAAFLVLVLVPFVKYPANPPGIGDPDTINERTLVFLTMVAISVLAAVAALRARAVLQTGVSGGTAMLAAAGLYGLVVLVAGIAMPTVDEVPSDFPATTLWDFRVASLGMLLVLWTVIGGVFAATARRVMAGKPILAMRRTTPGMEST